MSKYHALWKSLHDNGSQSFKLTFDEIAEIAGITIDELPMNLTEQMMKIAIETYKSAGDIMQAIYHETLLEDYEME